MAQWGRREDASLTGTIEVANTGDAVLTGNGTIFETETPLATILEIDGAYHTVVVVTSNTQITIEPALEADIDANSTIVISDSPSWMNEDILIDGQDMLLIDADEAANSAFSDIGLKTPGWTAYKTYTTNGGSVTRHKVDVQVAMKQPT